MAQPLLSIGMIVKNEIRCIEKCLQALQPLRDAIPCELVIADTGSDDGTRAVVQRYADICFDFAWVNDFSAARNAVLDRCSGRWTLTVDADEYLDPDIGQLVDFLTGPEESRYRLAMVNQYSYGDLEMKGEGLDFLAPRMARLDSNPRYSGLIHESFPPVARDQIKVLMEVKLHHDGYASDPKHPERGRVKAERNLALLDRELEKDPQDLRRLLQCVETSGPFPARKVDYVRRGMKALLQKRRTQAGAIYGPILSCHALEVAEQYDMPELEKWRSWTSSVYPDHMFLRLDGNYALVKHYLKKKKYQEIPQLAQAFLAAWQDFHDRNFDLNVLMYSVLHGTSRYGEAVVRAVGGESLGRLGQTGEAARLLADEPDWADMRPKVLNEFLKGCTWVAEELAVQQRIADGAAGLRAMSDKEGTVLWESFLAFAESAFQRRDPEEDGPQRPWRMYSRMDGALGRAAALMETDDLATVGELLAGIEEWQEVPAGAVARAIELGAELPDGFYRQKRERLQQVAGYLCRTLDGGVLLDWTARGDFMATMSRFQFLFELLSAVLQADKTWESEGELPSALCERFLDVAADYLPNYYNPQLLADEEEWVALPGVHRFALYLLRGRDAQRAGDMAGYLRFLRQGLQQETRMKKMVRFLSEAAKAASGGEVSPELKALADKVRTILAQYAPGDPAVVALKQSPAYQKVAYLLEEQDSGPVIDFI